MKKVCELAFEWTCQKIDGKMFIFNNQGGENTMYWEQIYTVCTRVTISIIMIFGARCKVDNFLKFGQT